MQSHALDPHTVHRGSQFDLNWKTFWGPSVEKVRWGWQGLQPGGARSLQGNPRTLTFDPQTPSTLVAEQWACKPLVAWIEKEGGIECYGILHTKTFSCARYNKPCSDACESRGESYYWCNTGSSWDYCSPPGNTLPLPVTICYFWDTSLTLSSTVLFQLRRFQLKHFWELFQLFVFNFAVSVETVEQVIAEGGGQCVGKWVLEMSWRLFFTSFGNIWRLLFMLPIDKHVTACYEVEISDCFCSCCQLIKHVMACHIRCDSLDENYTWCPVINVKGEGSTVIASPLSTYFPHHYHKTSNVIFTKLCWCRTLHELQ